MAAEEALLGSDAEMMEGEGGSSEGGSSFDSEEHDGEAAGGGWRGRP